MLFDYKCPMCGAGGKIWNRNPQTFVCLKCSTFYSKFGLVLETEKETDGVWT